MSLDPTRADQPGARAMPAWMQEIAIALPLIDGLDLTSQEPPADATPREAAVLLLFGEGPSGPEVLLLERAADLRSHPGQVAFPGGRRDGSDVDAVAAALREAEEETGLDPAGVDVVGVLPARWLSVTDFLVTPVVGWWRQPVAVRAMSAAETASVHVVPVAELLDPANRGRVQHPSGYVGPAFRVGDVLVWGFTALLLTGLFRRLGWEREWDPEQYYALPSAVLAGSQRDLASGSAAAGLATSEGAGR